MPAKKYPVRFAATFSMNRTFDVKIYTRPLEYLYIVLVLYSI